MNWQTTAYSSGPTFASQAGKQFRPQAITGGITNLNLKEPMMNNTWCPIMSTPAPVTISPPILDNSLYTYDPDVGTYPQLFSYQFSNFVPSRNTCPDTVFYYSTFIANTSEPLPEMITFDPTNLKYNLAVSNTLNVGLY